MKKSFFTSFIISLLSFSLIFVGVDKLVLSSRGEAGTTNNQRTKTKVKEGGEIVDKSVLVLLMGIDNDGPSANASLTQERGRRTDTIMLAKANFETGEIDILSIPRDTRVLVKGRKDKINHAHSYGGPDLAISTIENFLDLNIDYYVKVDFAGVKEIVDAIGGVELNVPVRMKYTDPVAKPPLRIDLQPGLQTLDGQKAHDYLRFRRYPEGDVGRVHAQQYFMTELAKQILQPSNILNIDKIIGTYYDYVDTNMPLSRMLKYALSAGKLDTENIRTEMIPGDFATIDGLSYWIYNEAETKQMVDAMFPEYKK